MTTSELVNGYYDGLSKRGDWASLLDDDVRLVMPGGAVTSGKAAVVKGTEQFMHSVRTASRKQMLVDGQTACVWMAYEVTSPNGRQATLDALEIWTANADRLQSMTLYFDTQGFQTFMQS